MSETEVFAWAMMEGRAFKGFTMSRAVALEWDEKDGCEAWSLGRIDRLQDAEERVEELERALRGILDHIDYPHPMENRQKKANELLDAARKALREEGG